MRRLAVFANLSSQGLARRGAAWAALAVVYVCVAKLGLLMDAVSGFATLVWPATGIAFVALSRFGPGLWPGVAIGALVVNLWTGAPLLVACGIAVGNTLEPLLGAWAVRRFSGMHDIPKRLSHVVALVTLAAIASTLVSAAVGTLSLALGGVVAPAKIAETARAWWLGDATGDLVVAPLLLAWSFDLGSLKRRVRRPWIVVEGFVLGAALAGASLLIFGTRFANEHAFTQVYMLFPLLIWASIRFGLRGSTAATCAVSVIAIWSTARGYGPFVHDRLATGLLFLQVFMAIVSITTLVLSVTIAERNHAVTARDWLLAAVAHDLKNPLQMIGLSTAFLERVLPPHDKQSRKLVSNLLGASDRMNMLVRDLLDLAAIEAGRFSLDAARIDARSLAQEVVASARPLADARSQSLLTTIGPNEVPVSCDRRRIMQVLINLVDNAIKFSPEGSSITVSVGSDASGVRFAVADAGPGIAHSDARRVFEPFWRARNSKREGTGLGLSIAKTIVETHGGKIWVESPGSGSTFAFSLPTDER